MADRTFKNQKNIDDALKLLKIVIDTFDKHDIKYYLDFGTLIGAMRDNAFIPWDDDIDISLLHEKDYEKIPEILNEIKKEYGYRTYLHTFKQSIEKYLKREKIDTAPNIDFTDENSYQIAKIRDNKFWIFGRGNVCIDIFFKYTYNNYSYWMSYGRVNSIPISMDIKDLKAYNFYDLKCMVPLNYNSYLKSIYGKWKDPDSLWTNEKDCLSIDGRNIV